MPRNGVYTSPQERQRIRQSYYATSEKEAGAAHLWHLQRLADISFNPNHTIQDAPEVNFRSPGSPMDPYKDLFAQRYAQQLQHDEAKVQEGNKLIYRNILLATDDTARRARNMNLVPTEDQVRRFDNIQQQTLHRTKHRAQKQRIVAEENRKLLGYLISVPPNVRPAKELDAWYHNVHKKRVAQLSKYKPAERYAGARLLEGTAGSRGNSLARDAFEKLKKEYGTRLPLVRGRPYPLPSVAEFARTAPSSLKPATTATSFNGISLFEAADTVGSNDRLHRPDWQPIAATDIPLLHYGADQQLRSEYRDYGSAQSKSTPPSRSMSPTPRDVLALTQSSGSINAHLLNMLTTKQVYGSTYSGRQSNNNNNSGRNATSGGSGSVRKAQSARRVTPEEEGGVTQLWRRAVEHRYGSGGVNHNHNSENGVKSTRAMAPNETDGGQNKKDVKASMPSPFSSALPLSGSTQQQISAAQLNTDGHQKQRLVRPTSPRDSRSRSPLAATRVAAEVPSDEHSNLAERGNAVSASVEASGATYVPV